MAIFSAAKTRLFHPNFADPGQDHDAMAGLYPAIMVAIIVDHAAIIQGSCRKLERMVCHTDSSRCERRRYRAGAKEEDHEPEAETGQKKVRKASQDTPTRNPPITIHIIHLVSAIPPPYCYFIPYLKNFS